MPKVTLTILFCFTIHKGSFVMIHKKKSIVHLKELLLLLNDTYTIVFRSYLI